MLNLAVAALFLLVSHFGISSTRLRPLLIARLGLGPYLGLYSVIAVIALVWLASAYAAAPYVGLWGPSSFQAGLAVLIMALAVLLLIGGVTSPNPTIVKHGTTEGALPTPRGALRITRHPVMWSFGLFGLVHMLANGDLASLILFGAISVLALAGTVLIDRRYRLQHGDDYARVVAVTSNLPFGAVLAGRQRLEVGEFGWWRLASAIGLLLLLLVLHPLVIGPSVLAAL